jgi:putative selenium metabolism hydrolase
MIISERCVESPEDVFYDEFGNLVWVVQDKEDGVPADKKRVIYFDGHSDTVNALRTQWHEILGDGVDPYNGLLDAEKVDYEALKGSLGWCVPKEDFKHCVFGRGSADQLAGVISQIIGTKLMVEFKSKGALKGVLVRSIATVAEEDNDGGGAMYYSKKHWLNHDVQELPDVIVLTEGTGDSKSGSVAIYRGQRGRMQIEVDIIGRSCHGSMPHEGLNPLEFGAKILVQAVEQVANDEGIKTDPFLGKGTRTASWSKLETPSDCAVPARFVFRFDRRITAGESPLEAVAMVEKLPAVAEARKAGLKVKVGIPVYSDPTHTGYIPGNEAVYMCWVTPEDHNAITTAVSTYKQTITPYVRADLEETAGRIRKNPRVDKWIFSTDGVGYPVPIGKLKVPEHKKWIVDNGSGFTYPAMIGIGAGLEHHCHKVGEYIDSRDLMHVLSFMGRFPSKYVEEHPIQ